VDSPYWLYKQNWGYNIHSKWDGPLVCTSFPATSNDRTSNQCLCDLPLGLGTNFFENSFHGLKKSFGEWTHFGSLGNLTRPTRKPNVTGSEFRYHQQGNMRGYQHAIQNGSRVLFSFWNLSIHFISSPFWSYRQNNTYINGLEGKILTETIEFPIKIMGLKPVNFALNQSIEIFSSGYPMVFPHEIPIWWLRSKVTSRPRTPKAHHAWKEVMRLSWQFWAKP